MIDSGRADSLEKWRLLARQFHAIDTRWPGDFEPADLQKLPCETMTPAVAGVIKFLLHIWNSENLFDLSEVQRWDRAHLRGFKAWVLGEITGEPCRYF